MKYEESSSEIEKVLGGKMSEVNILYAEVFNTKLVNPFWLYVNN